MFGCKAAKESKGMTNKLLCLMIVTSISTSAWGEDITGHSRQARALSDCQSFSQNYAVLMRMQFNRLTADPEQSSSHVVYILGVRTHGEGTVTKHNELWFKSSYSAGMDQAGQFSVEQVSELFANYGDRTFIGVNSGAEGGAIRKEFAVRELTEQIKNDEAFKTYAERTRRELKVNPLALPFLSTSAIAHRDADFSRVHQIMRNWEVEYETENDSGFIVVWVGSKRNAASSYQLEREFDFLPTRVCVYTRPVSEKRLIAGAPLGDLLYRTSTKWDRFEFQELNIGDSKSPQEEVVKSVWLPTRIELEAVPDSSLHVLEIDCQWKLGIADNMITPDGLLGKKSPNPVTELYSELSIELDETLQANNRKNRRPQ